MGPGRLGVRIHRRDDGHDPAHTALPPLRGKIRLRHRLHHPALRDLRPRRHRRARALQPPLRRTGPPAGARCRCGLLDRLGGAVAHRVARRPAASRARSVWTGGGSLAMPGHSPRGRERLAGSLATAANMGGLGLGIMMSGFLARFASGPLFTPFLVNAITLVIAGAALLLVRDRTRGNPAAVPLQLPGIPPESRSIFLAASPGAVTGFAICGLYSAVAPSFIGQSLHLTSTAVTGSVVFLLFGASATAQLLFRGQTD